MTHIAELLKIAEILHPVQQGLLVEMARAMDKGFYESVAPVTDIADPAFCLAFASRLCIHHAVNEGKLAKKAFEYAFASACRSAGREASVESNTTNPGADVVVNDVRYSLKTEASKGMKKKSITISKLMEARWIRDCSCDDDFCTGTHQNVVSHLWRYDRILVLRAFDQEETHVEYQLMEIPLEQLQKVDKLSSNDFAGKRTKSGGSSALVPISEKESFKITLDGSVEKVTISGFPVSACIHHATWTIPVGRNTELLDIQTE